MNIELEYVDIMLLIEVLNEYIVNHYNGRGNYHSLIQAYMTRAKLYQIHTTI